MDDKARIAQLEKEVAELRQALKSAGVAVHSGTQRRPFWARLFGADVRPVHIQSQGVATIGDALAGAPQQVRHVWQMGNRTVDALANREAGFWLPFAQGFGFGVTAGVASLFVSVIGDWPVTYAPVVAFGVWGLSWAVLMIENRGLVRLAVNAQSGNLARNKRTPVPVGDVRHTDERGALAQLSRLIVPASAAQYITPEVMRVFAHHAVVGKSLGVHSVTPSIMPRSAYLAMRDEMLIHGLMGLANRTGAVYLTRSGRAWLKAIAK